MCEKRLSAIFPEARIGALAAVILATGCSAMSEAGYADRSLGMMERDSLALGEPSGEDMDVLLKRESGIELAQMADSGVRAFVPGQVQTSLSAQDAGEPAATAAPAATQAPPAPRLRTYSSLFQLLVPTVSEAIEKFLAEVETSGGYLEKRENESIVCRVPAARFQEIVAKVRATGRVLFESTQVTDVSSQYRDLELRIDVALKSRLRLLALLEKADTTKDALEIETEIRRLTEEIERMEGSLRSLAGNIAYSRLEVSFQAAAPPAKPASRITESRFAWINELGVEHVLARY